MSFRKQLESLYGIKVRSFVRIPWFTHSLPHLQMDKCIRGLSFMDVSKCSSVTTAQILYQSPSKNPLNVDYKTLTM